MTWVIVSLLVLNLIAQVFYANVGARNLVKVAHALQISLRK